MTFEEIYCEHSRMVYNLSLHFVQNIEDAEEITQDVFIKVFENLHDFKKESGYKTWIYRICINQSLDFLKSKKSKRKRFLNSILRLNDKDFRHEPANFNHPGIELEQKENLQKIFGAINQLSDQQKTVIILLKIEGKTQLETAIIMRLHVKAVESLFQRAKKNLKIHLHQKSHV